MAALVVLRDDVVKPLLAAQGKLKAGRPPVRSSRLTRTNAALRHGMRDLFQELGIAACNRQIF